MLKLRLVHPDRSLSFSTLLRHGKTSELALPSRSNEKERSELKGGFRGNVDVKMTQMLAFVVRVAH
jgi:hypothetical protein